MAVAGQITLKTGPSCARVTNDASDRLRKVWRRITAQVMTMIRANQKGKNPLFGPSVPQPTPSRTASKRTTPPNSSKMEAVMKSAMRISLAEQSALGHQIFMKLFVGLNPLDVLIAGRKRGLQRAFGKIFLELCRVVNFFQKIDVPLHGIFRDPRRAEDAAQHEIMDVGAKRFLDRRYPFPILIGNSRGVENRQRSHAARLPMTHTFGGIIDRRIDMLADQIHTDLATAFKWHVRKLDSQRLFQLDRDDLIFLRRARATHLHSIASGRLSLHSCDIFLRGLVGRFGVHP